MGTITILLSLLIIYLLFNKQIKIGIKWLYEKLKTIHIKKEKGVTFTCSADELDQEIEYGLGYSESEETDFGEIITSASCIHYLSTEELRKHCDDGEIENNNLREWDFEELPENVDIVRIIRELQQLPPRS